MLAKKTQVDMLQYRGYNIDKEKWILVADTSDMMEYYAAKINKGKQLDELLTKTYHMDNGLSTIVCYIFPDKNSNIALNELDITINKISNTNLTNRILIYDGKFTPQATKTIKQLQFKFENGLQLFKFIDLTCNPLDQVDSPQYILLSKEETRKKLTEMKTSISQILVMKHEYPIAKFCGWKRGDMIKIIRDDNSLNYLQPKNINYRIVV